MLPAQLAHKVFTDGTFPDRSLEDILQAMNVTSTAYGTYLRENNLPYRELTERFAFQLKRRPFNTRFHVSKEDYDRAQNYRRSPRKSDTPRKSPTKDPLIQDRNDAIAEDLRNSNMTQVEIAAKHGVSAPTVSDVRDTYGIESKRKARKQTLSSEQRQGVSKAKGKMSATDAASKYDVAVSTVYYIWRA